jgi:hypothetical protein
MLACALAGLILTGGSDVRAQADDHGRAGRLAVELFVDACIGTIAIPANVEEFVASRAYPPVAARFAPAFFQGQKGKAWSAEKEGGEFVVAQRADTSCTVYARRASGAAVQARLERVLSDIVSDAPQLKLHVESDKAEVGPKGEYRSVARILTFPKGRRFMILATTSEASGADVQAMLTASFVRD